jgi:transposase-like protein
LKPGDSVSVVARTTDVKTNQAFKWRRQYRQGRLEMEAPPTSLPVKASDGTPTIQPET